MNRQSKGIKMFGSYEPAATYHEMGGVRHRFKFPNGYGASVICHQYSYGGSEGLWEVAVVGRDGHLTGETAVTDDVLGWLAEAEVTEALDGIAALDSVSP